MIILSLLIGSMSYAADVSSFVTKQVDTKPSTSILVLLKSQVDFEGKVFPGMTRAKRIDFVYQALVKNANDSQKSLTDFLDSKKKITYRRYFISNAILIDNANKTLVTAISKMPEVAKIVGNPSVPLKRPIYFDKGIQSLKSVNDNISSVGADRVWKELGISGENIVIAGQDTGIQWDHPALQNHYRGWNGKSATHDYNWHDSIHSAFNPDILSGSKSNKCGYALKAPCDDDQHGTHTMGTMIGSDGADKQIGMAPGAKFIGCRNMDAGFGSPASYLECFQFFLAPTPVSGNPFTDGKPEYAPHVINNSWGCDPDEGCSGDEMLPALKAMKAAGIVVVASAGNDGPDCGTIKSPPAYHTAYVLSVGAINHRSGNIASFSSRGPSTFDGGVGPDIVAPGVSILSSVPDGKYAQQQWSGTSMAGPHVVGQVALILSAQPNLIGKVDDVIAIVRSSAENTSSSESCGGVAGGTIPNNTYGYGKIRVFESVKAAMAL